jgi:hypothetical protein
MPSFWSAWAPCLPSACVDSRDQGLPARRDPARLLDEPRSNRRSRANARVCATSPPLPKTLRREDENNLPRTAHGRIPARISYPSPGCSMAVGSRCCRKRKNERIAAGRMSRVSAELPRVRTTRSLCRHRRRRPEAFWRWLLDSDASSYLRSDGCVRLVARLGSAKGTGTVIDSDTDDDPMGEKTMTHPDTLEETRPGTTLKNDSLCARKTPFALHGCATLFV